ncbi:phosphotransferase family protein [Aspergillus ibericus CBS 121593]|uniref:Kinase-like protein n=1 Tax=Aspergillus ibericus CBS 121593 TaxID=1448316 RepID=A0A395H393_9EURO|nr:kinase-like protein [Aspergillus ibericus CBS 121593]RAL02216.1 kinase-like protein [Aspergillus ibericus CBS 121593]
MEFDQHVVAKQEQKAAVWLRLWSSRSPEILSMQLAQKHRPGKPTSACLWKSGAFNICYRVRYDEGSDVIVRIAALGRAILRREKVRNEVATMRYLSHTTSIPVPEVFGSGICWAGPYIVMSFLEGMPLSQVLKDPSVEGRPVLNPQISDRSLKRAYREMAGLILELSKHEFDTIGALEETERGLSITRRPLTFNMNELMVSANLPEEVFPSHTFSSATDYFQALARQHLSHLRLQEHDAVSSEEDCRKKFTARCLFLNITKKLGTEHTQGPFRLYCDDFRPSNILIDLDTTRGFRVSGVIDWEFTYTAPAEFIQVAPWWLLLQSLEDWEGDLNEFLIRYTPRLHTFLEVLSDCENKLIEQHLLSESQRLSPRMALSMETGLFWVCLAARYSSMFDEIYWSFIDQRYHGAFISLDARMRLLDPEQQREMDELVRLKTAQCATAQEGFNDHYPIDQLLEL